LRERALALGFQSVVVIDEDLGRSGTGSVERPAFGRLLAAVCSGKVGAVLALEASRLARNNRDWHHLIDLCAVAGTLVIDHDDIYDPSLLDDRLLLGLKGTMSEFEISLLRQRAMEARRQKVGRGLVLTQVPVGYVRTEDEGIEKTLDRQVQEAIAGIFRKLQRQQLLALGDDLEQLWDHPRSPVTRKKRILRTVLQEVIADTTDDPPSVHLKLHWAGGSHTELTVPKNRTGYHNHINSQEVTELIRELALVCEDASIVSILNRLGYRTGNSNTWTEKRVQHVRHTNDFPACPPPHQRLWITMQQGAAALGVSEMVVRRLIAQKILPAKQIVKFAPWMIERTHLQLPAMRKQIRRVHEGRRPGWAVNEKQDGLFTDSHEVQP
jgi:DNA invertase Pin-like site-specific DNA recombinase